jgi:hypothetical protein
MGMKKSRSPLIMADAAYEILTSDSKKTTDQFFFDDEVLLSVYGQDFNLDQYRMVKEAKDTDLLTDFMV